MSWLIFQCKWTFNSHGPWSSFQKNMKQYNTQLCLTKNKTLFIQWMETWALRNTNAHEIRLCRQSLLVHASQQLCCQVYHLLSRHTCEVSVPICMLHVRHVLLNNLSYCDGEAGPAQAIVGRGLVLSLQDELRWYGRRLGECLQLNVVGRVSQDDAAKVKPPAHGKPPKMERHAMLKLFISRNGEKKSVWAINGNINQVTKDVLKLYILIAAPLPCMQTDLSDSNKANVI